MYSTRTIIKNLTWLQFSSIVNNLLGGILGILVARYLGSHNYGLYASAVVATTLFALFLDFGFSELMVREGSRIESQIRSYLGSVLLAYSGLFIVSYLIMIVYAWLADYPEGIITLISIYGIGNFFSRGWRIWQGIFRIKQRLDLQAKLEVAAALLRGFMVAGFLLLRLGLLELVSIHAFVSTFFFVLHLILGTSIYRPTFSLSKTMDLILPALPFGISAALFFGYSQTNIFILSLMTKPKIIGAFAAVFRLIIFANEFSLIVFNSTLLPIMFKSYKEDQEYLKKIYSISSKYMLGLGLLISFFLFFYAKTIVLNIFGQSYDHAVVALQIMAFCVAIRYLSCGVEATLTAIDRIKDKVFIQTAVAIMNIALNLLLIPLYSLNGAALATLTSEGLLLVLLIERTGKCFVGLSITRDLHIDKLVLTGAVLFSLAFLARGRISDFITIPVLLFIALFVLKISKFIDFQLENGRLVFRSSDQ